MSDEDLVIGKGELSQQTPQAQGQSGLSTPMDFVNVSVFGVFKDSEKDNPSSKDDEYVEQKFGVKVPRGERDEDVAQFVWRMHFLPQVCLRAIGTAGEVNFYPLDRFKRFTIRVSNVVGVSL